MAMIRDLSRTPYKLAVLKSHSQKKKGGELRPLVVSVANNL